MASPTHMFLAMLGVGSSLRLAHVPAPPTLRPLRVTWPEASADAPLAAGRHAPVVCSASGGGAATDDIDDRLAAERAAITELRARVSDLEATVEAQREAVRAKAVTKAGESEPASAEAGTLQSALDRARAAVEAAEAQIGSAQLSGTAAPGSGGRVAEAVLDESILPALFTELEPLFAANATNFAACWGEVRVEVEAAWREAWAEQAEELVKLSEAVGATKEELAERTAADLESWAIRIALSDARTEAALAPFRAFVDLPPEIASSPDDTEPDDSILLFKGRMIKRDYIPAAIRTLREHRYRRFALCLGKRERFLRLASDGEQGTMAGVLASTGPIFNIVVSNVVRRDAASSKSSEEEKEFANAFSAHALDSAPQELDEYLTDGSASDAGPWLRRYLKMMQAHPEFVSPVNMLVLVACLSGEDIDAIAIYMSSRALAKLNLARLSVRKGLPEFTTAQLETRVAAAEANLQQKELWRDFLFSSVGSCFATIVTLWLGWALTGWAVSSVVSLFGGGGSGGSGLDGFGF